MSIGVGIIGGGTFGKALALAAARGGRRVTWWSRRQDRPTEHEHITPTTDIAAVGQADLIFVAVPSAYVPELADELGLHLDGSHFLVHVSRGLVGDDLQTLTEILRMRTPVRRVGALAGPLVAAGLLEEHPGGAIIGTLFPEVVEAVREAIAGPRLRIYSTDDVAGVEVASAYVGLLAVALGYAMGQGFGPGTLAVIGTRGLAEAARVAARKGADARTFSGLAGAGDLIAAVAGDRRPEVEMGRALAEGASLDEAARRAGAYIEGVGLANRISAFAERQRLEAPLATALAQLLQRERSAGDLLRALMTRPPAKE